MFTVKFSGNVSNPELFGGYLWNGIASNGDSVRFSNDIIKVAFWGVLYNKRKLGLDSLNNDAEAIAILFQSSGLESFNQLDGKFTFVLTTGTEKIIVRDHHGTGTQVYYNDSHCSSSLKMLQRTPGFSTEVDAQAIGSFLSVGYITTGRSAFVHTHKLNAGSALVFRDSSLRVINLFDTSSITPATGKRDLEATAQEYGRLHSKAIGRRIGCSDNVGILLSGGYDSGCNLAALRNIYNGDIHSYSIGFKGDNWSELPLAECMSNKFGTIHNTYEIDGSEILELPKIVAELGDPFVEGGLMVNYTAMQMIGSKKPDVILGGDGSDQYFGTSGREVATHYLAAKYGVKPLLKMAYGLLSREAFDQNNTPYRMRFHLSKVLNIMEGDKFGFEHFKLNKIIKEGYTMAPTQKTKLDTRSFEHLYTQHAYKSDLELIINQVILFKASYLAQMFGNNLTFPYMDLELYKFLEALPVEYKCKGDSVLKIAKGESTHKFLLKYHYKPLLPQAITSKKKQGGFAPMPIFFKDKKQRDNLADFIMQSSVTNEFLNREGVEKFIKTYDTQANEQGNWFWYKQNQAIQYFNLLNLAIWWEQYVKSNELVSL